jgi:hypothetical protein
MSETSTNERIWSEDEINTAYHTRNKWIKGLQQNYYAAFETAMPGVSIDTVFPIYYSKQMFIPTTDTGFAAACFLAWGEFRKKQSRSYIIVAVSSEHIATDPPLLHEERIEFKFKILRAKTITRVILISNLNRLEFKDTNNLTDLLIDYINDADIYSAYEAMKKRHV